MVKETSALVATYLDGAGIFAWQENADATGYEPVELPANSTIEDLDTALWRIESEINKAISAGALNEKIEPAAPIDPDQLEPDEASAD